MAEQLKLDWVGRISLFFGAIMAVGYLLNGLLVGHLFWDMQVYVDAVKIRNNGGSAYEDLGGLKFVYAPVVLRIFSIFDSWLPIVLGISYFSITVALLTRVEGRVLVTSTLISSFWFFDFSFPISIQTGNVTLFLHFALIYSAIVSHQNSRFVFLFMVALASVVKPYFISYLFLGVAIWPIDRRFVFHSIFVVSIVFLSFALQKIFLSDEFDQWLSSLSAQALGERAGPGRDVGRAPYFFFSLVFGKGLGLLLHIASIAFGALFLALIYKRSCKVMTVSERKMLLFWFALVVCILMNPRMKIYDWWVLQGGCVAIIFIYLKYRVLNSYYMIFIGSSFCLVWILEKTGYISSGKVIEIIQIYFPLLIVLLLGLYFSRGDIKRNMELI